MAHNISCIITNFKYEGRLPNVILEDNYHLIILDHLYGLDQSDEPLAPYGELTMNIVQEIKTLSTNGKCAYIETAYFGGIGVQISESWENGAKIEGPLISYDGIEQPSNQQNALVVEYSINQTLRKIGVKKHMGKDEFDSLGLGKYRSNRRILDEYESRQRE